MRAPARLHLLGAGIMGTVQREMSEDKKERNASGLGRNWNKQGNHRRWLRAARGGSRIKDEALQAALTGWSGCWSVGEAECKCTGGQESGKEEEVSYETKALSIPLNTCLNLIGRPSP